MTKKIFITKIMLVLILSVACASKKNSVEDILNETIQPKLIFLNYNLSKTENNYKNIEFISQKITDGKLKSYSNKYIETGSIGDLKCSQLNKDSVELSSVILKNPLSKAIEYVNDSLIFENKIIALKKASFTLRLQLHNKTKFIVIKEITDSLQNSNMLIINKLK